MRKRRLEGVLVLHKLPIYCLKLHWRCEHTFSIIGSNNPPLLHLYIYLPSQHLAAPAAATTTAITPLIVGGSGLCGKYAQLGGHPLPLLLHLVLHLHARLVSVVGGGALPGVHCGGGASGGGSGDSCCSRGAFKGQFALLGGCW